MDWQRADNIVTTHLGSILVIALVGISAFVLGSQFRTNLPPEEEVEVTQQKETTTSPTITQLQQLISNPQSSTPTTVVVDTSVQQTGLVNINSATLTQLDTLPGIGPSKGQAIIDYRQANGPFIRAEDLMKVKGIGPKTLENLRALITL